VPFDERRGAFDIELAELGVDIYEHGLSSDVANGVGRGDIGKRR